MSKSVSLYTAAQMEALEEFITESLDASDFAKRIIIWLLRKTHDFNRQVFVFLPVEVYGDALVKEAQDGAHDMNSCNGSTHLNLFLRGMGGGFHLGHNDSHPGHPSRSGRCLWWERMQRKVPAWELPNVKPPSKRTLARVGPKDISELGIDRINGLWPSRCRV